MEKKRKGTHSLFEMYKKEKGIVKLLEAEEIYHEIRKGWKKKEENKHRKNKSICHHL